MVFKRLTFLFYHKNIDWVSEKLDKVMMIQIITVTSFWKRKPYIKYYRYPEFRFSLPQQIFSFKDDINLPLAERK